MTGSPALREYQERLRTTGAGISARTFLERGLRPTLRTLGTSRAELKGAMARLGAASIEAAATLAK
jgi:hypothetical protein